MKINIAAAFILGIAVGLWLYKYFIITVIDKIPHTPCDYCEFKAKREETENVRKIERNGRKNR